MTPDLFDWTPPPRALARAADPGTSHRAAASLSAELPELEALVMRTLAPAGERGMTLDEVCAATGLDKVTASPRFKPLEAKQLLRRAEKTRPGASGRQQTVWVAR